jgi:hypothetical protein
VLFTHIIMISFQTYCTIKPGTILVRGFIILICYMKGGNKIWIGNMKKDESTV